MAAELKRPPHAAEPPRSTKVVKVATAVTVGGSCLVLSGLTLVGTVLALALATPLVVLFSPVLVPATIAVSLIVVGFVSSGGLGVAAVTVLAWMVRYLSGKKELIGGGAYLDEARSRLASKVREMKERAGQYATAS